MRFAATILACVVGLGMASGQTHMQPEVRVRGGPYILPPPVITAQTDLVALEVVVRRPDGALVGGLSRDNFIVLDNGKRRVLATFSVETAPAPPMAAPPPAATGSAARDQKTEAGGFAAPPRSSAAPLRSIGLYFDDVSTDGGDLENARNAAERFVREALAPEDLVAVFTASGEQSLDFTRNAGELQAAVALIRAHPRAGRSLLMCPQITAYQAYLIAEVHEQSALQAAAEEFLHCPGSTARDSLTGKPMSLGEQNEYEEVLAQAEATWDQARGNSY
ncbi:MAG: VWA domain-containing protein, partial [Streptosporangiaceae bacterium]